MRWRRSAGRTYAGFFSDSLPAKEIAYSLTSKSCDNSNILVLTKITRMGHQKNSHAGIQHSTTETCTLWNWVVQSKTKQRPQPKIIKIKGPNNGQQAIFWGKIIGEVSELKPYSNQQNLHLQKKKKKMEIRRLSRL